MNPSGQRSVVSEIAFDDIVNPVATAIVFLAFEIITCYSDLLLLAHVLASLNLAARGDYSTPVVDSRGSARVRF